MSAGTPGKPVPFVDLGRQHAPIADELEASLLGAVARGDFILGSDLEAFEAEFASYLGVRHAIGVGSGTAAISIALCSAGIGAGDEVIVPAHTYIASALGVLHAGAEPVLCDVDDETGLIDFESAAEVVGPRTAAVLIVHLYGQVVDPDAAKEFAGRHQIALLEDAAQAHGASWERAMTGSFGVASAFSFYPSKNLGAFGDGGLVATSDDAVAGKARRLRNLGQERKGEHLEPGFNERLDTVQAAVLRTKLKHLDKWNESRRDAAAVYRRHLPAGALVLPEREAAGDVFHLFPIRVDDRDRVAAELGDAGIGTGLHYSPALTGQPPLEGARRAENLSTATGWGERELSLPMFPGITEDEIVRTCRALETSI